MFWLYQLQHIMSLISDFINASEMSVMKSLEAVTHMIHLAQSCIITEFFEKGSDIHHAHCDGVIEGGTFFIISIIIVFMCAETQPYCRECPHQEESFYFPQTET